MKNYSIEYYDKNAEKFFGSTVGVEFNEKQERFLTYLKKGDKILDFGCGSGRDMKYFLEQGYFCDGIDGSEKMCELASLYVKKSVQKMCFEELEAENEYDGIWACASILHLNQKRLLEVFEKIAKALKENGILYSSFKYGTFEGMRNGRYFLDLDEKKLKEILDEIDLFWIEEIWVTKDVRQERNTEKWLNTILRKKGKR